MSRVVYPHENFTPGCIRAWLEAHVSPMTNYGVAMTNHSGLFWWKGQGWNYDYYPFTAIQGVNEHKIIHTVTFDDHVDEGLIAQFALAWS